MSKRIKQNQLLTIILLILSGRSSRHLKLRGKIFPFSLPLFWCTRTQCDTNTTATTTRNPV